MKSLYLFPAGWRLIGMVLLLAGLLFFYIDVHYGISLLTWPHFDSSFHGIFNTLNEAETFDDEIQLTLVLAGLTLVAFTKERIEDEQIVQLRLDSLQWAVYVNYTVFLIIIFASYGFNFLFYTLYNVLTLLIIFIIRFRWLMYKNNRLMAKEARLA